MLYQSLSGVTFKRGHGAGRLGHLKAAGVGEDFTPQSCIQFSCVLVYLVLFSYYLGF